MSSYVLDHGSPSDIPDASWIWEFRTCVGIFELRSGNGRIWSTDILLSGALPFRRRCRRHLFGVAGNRKQHLAAVPQSACALSSAEWMMLFPLQRCGRSASIRFATFCGRGAACSRDTGDAGLFLLEHSDDGFLIAIHELRGIEVRRLALEDVLGQLEHIRLDPHVRNVLEIILRVPDLVRIAERGGHQPLCPRARA